MASATKAGLNQCPNCSSLSLVSDEETGDILCINCGYVLTERAAAEYGRNFLKKEISPEEAGPFLSLTKPDLGLATEMGPLRGVGRLRRAEARTFYTRRQRTLARALKLIRNLGDKLGLGPVISERAAYFYRIAVREGLLTGRPAKLLASAAVYAACREAGIPRSIVVVAETAGFDRKKLAAMYRKLTTTLNLRMAVIGPERYVAKIADLLSINERTKREAYSILARAERNGLAAGKDPKGLAAGALCLASQSAIKRPTKVDFARAAGVTTVTLRKRLKQLKKYL